MVTLLDSNLIPAQETLGLCDLSYNAFIIIIINNINAKNKDFSSQFHSHRQSNILICNENPQFYLGLRFKKAWEDEKYYASSWNLEHNHFESFVRR